MGVESQLNWTSTVVFYFLTKRCQKTVCLLDNWADNEDSKRILLTLFSLSLIILPGTLPFMVDKHLMLAWKAMLIFCSCITPSVPSNIIYLFIYQFKILAISLLEWPWVCFDMPHLSLFKRRIYSQEGLVLKVFLKIMRLFWNIDFPYSDT